MDKLFLISLMAILVSIEAGIFNNHVKLYNMCRGNNFKYKDQEVNAVYQLEKEFKFDKLEKLQLNRSIDMRRWGSYDEIIDLAVIKEVFNSKIRYNFGQTLYVLNKEILNYYRKKIPNHVRDFLTIKEKMDNHEDKAIYYDYLNTFSRTLSWIDLLYLIYENEVNEKYIQKDEFESLLKSIPVDKKKRDLILGDEDIKPYYEQKLLKLNFMKAKEGVLSLHIFVPVTRKDYFIPLPLFCKSRKDLPAFFRE